MKTPVAINPRSLRIGSLPLVAAIGFLCLFLFALAGQDAESPAPTPDLWTTFHELAMRAYRAGKLPEAERLFLEALVEAESAGEENQRLSLTLNNLGELYRRQQRYQAAEKLFLRALEIDQRRLGPEHFDVAVDLNNLGLVCLLQKKFDLAEKYYRRSLRIKQLVLPGNHLSLAIGYHNLARVYEQRGELQTASDWFHKALSVYDQNAQPRENPSYLVLIRQYAATLHRLGQEARANQLLTRLD